MTAALYDVGGELNHEFLPPEFVITPVYDDAEPALTARDVFVRIVEDVATFFALSWKEDRPVCVVTVGLMLACVAMFGRLAWFVTHPVQCP